MARIETALAPTGAVVKSPDRLRDLVTGEWREVDASVRSRVGSADVLITIECRDRAKAEDVTWIEQLSAKRQHVGAALTVAVSSEGFSAPALTAARAAGIATRIIEHIDSSDILSWAHLTIATVVTYVLLDAMEVSYHGIDEEPPPLAAEVIERMETGGAGAKLFSNAVTGEGLSIEDLVRIAAGGGIPIPPGHSRVQLKPGERGLLSSSPLQQIFRDVPQDGAQVRRDLRFDFPPGNVAVETVRGRRELEHIQVSLRVASVETPLAPKRTVRYTGAAADSALSVEVVEHELEPGMIIAQHRVVKPKEEEGH